MPFSENFRKAFSNKNGNRLLKPDRVKTKNPMQDVHRILFYLSFKTI